MNKRSKIVTKRCPYCGHKIKVDIDTSVPGTYTAICSNCGNTTQIVVGRK